MQVAPDAPRRPALRWHGGKFSLAPWIISHFPPHTCYCEPFGGGASVLLRKPPAKIDVYNDLFGDAVNFFRVLRERPAELLAAIDLTPYSRAEFMAAQKRSDDPLEAARRFYVWSWQGRGRAGVKEPGGWRFMSRDTRGKTPVDDWTNNEHLWSVVKRLRHVQIESDDALAVVRRYDTSDTLFYVDPPYVQSERGDRWKTAAYALEYSDDDHAQLAGVLNDVQGYVALSGYNSQIYNDLYSSWQRVEKDAATDNMHRNTTECLWLSPRTWAVLQSGAGLPLFGGGNGV